MAVWHSRSRHRQALDFIENAATIEERYQLRQAIAATHDGFFYGDIGTIHGSGTINVQVDKAGAVVDVWFRCQRLPFTVSYNQDSPSAGVAEVQIRGIELE